MVNRGKYSFHIGFNTYNISSAFGIGSLWRMRLYSFVIFVLLSFLLNQANAKEHGAVDLGGYPDIFQNFKECGINLQYDVNQSALIVKPRYRIHVDRGNAKLKDQYATVRIRGKLLGFPISVLRVPTIKGSGVLIQYMVTMNGKVNDVRNALVHKWGVIFDFRGPDDGPDVGDGPQITYTAEVRNSVGKLSSRLFLFAYSEKSKETYLQCEQY